MSECVYECVCGCVCVGGWVGGCVMLCGWMNGFSLEEVEVMVRQIYSSISIRRIFSLFF